MPAFGDEDGQIDVHDYRHGLKLLQETRETSHWRNKNDYECPACGRVFGDLLITEKQHNSFDPSTNDPFCLRREAERILLFRH